MNPLCCCRKGLLRAVVECIRADNYIGRVVDPIIISAPDDFKVARELAGARISVVALDMPDNDAFLSVELNPLWW
jgi:hypothetical protein